MPGPSCVSSRFTSFIGGSPKRRLYSRINCGALSYHRGRRVRDVPAQPDHEPLGLVKPQHFHELQRRKSRHGFENAVESGCRHMDAVRKLIHPDRFPVVRPDPLHGLRDRVAAGPRHHELPDGFPGGRLQDPVVDFAGHEGLQHLSVLGVFKKPREPVKGVRERQAHPGSSRGGGSGHAS